MSIYDSRAAFDWLSRSSLWLQYCWQDSMPDKIDYTLAQYTSDGVETYSYRLKSIQIIIMIQSWLNSIFLFELVHH